MNPVRPPCSRWSQGPCDSSAPQENRHQQHPQQRCKDPPIKRRLKQKMPRLGAGKGYSLRTRSARRATGLLRKDGLSKDLNVRAEALQFQALGSGSLGQPGPDRAENYGCRREDKRGTGIRRCDDPLTTPGPGAALSCSHLCLSVETAGTLTIANV